MPFITIDEGGGEDFVGAMDTGGAFVYRSSDGVVFNSIKFDPASQAILKALLALGATGLRATYDGGYDEGFVHPEAFFFGDDTRSIESVKDELGAGSLAAELREVNNRRANYEEREVPNDVRLIQIAIYHLADDLACCLLGDRYGTGNYRLYGAFTAHLTSGEILDDALAAPPPPRPTVERCLPDEHREEIRGADEIPW